MKDLLHSLVKCSCRNSNPTLRGINTNSLHCLTFHAINACTTFRTIPSFAKDSLAVGAISLARKTHSNVCCCSGVGLYRFRVLFTYTQCSFDSFTIPSIAHRSVTWASACCHDAHKGSNSSGTGCK
jgi:hypothetical protein